MTNQDPPLTLKEVQTALLTVLQQLDEAFAAIADLQYAVQDRGIAVDGSKGGSSGPSPAPTAPPAAPTSPSKSRSAKSRFVESKEGPDG